MKSNFIPIVLAICLLASMSGSAKADSYEKGSYEECCRNRCYECACNPLYCGAWDLQVQAGVVPISWHHSGAFYSVDCARFVGNNPVQPLFSVPKFSKFFKKPWTLGGQLGYAYSDNARVYAEVNYLRSNGKHAVTLITINPLINPADVDIFTFGRYKLFDAYVGARYYFDRWCNRISCFVGVKMGLTHYEAVDFNTSLLINGGITPVVIIPESADARIYKRTTVISGGAHLGFDVGLCSNWSFAITGEIVASCGRHTSNIPTVVTPGVNTQTNLLIGAVGTELRFPVTGAIRYSF